MLYLVQVLLKAVVGLYIGYNCWNFKSKLVIIPKELDYNDFN